MRIESRDTEKNLLLRNVPVNDEEPAKKIFEKVITDGIGMNLDFEYSEVDINREIYFFQSGSCKKRSPNSYIEKR